MLTLAWKVTSAAKKAALILAILAVLVLTFAPTVRTKTPALSSAVGSALSQLLQSAVERGDVPAVVVLVTSGNQVIFEGSAGKADVAGNVPLRPNAIFRIASMTKALTSTALMMLVDEGRVRLDDRADRYLPAIASMKVATHVKEDGSFEPRPPRRPITVRHLLAHTSGIGYSFSSTLLFKLEAAGKTEPDFPLLHDPGDHWSYGASTKHVGDIVERVSGQPIEAFLRARLFQPLGMVDTAYEVPASGRPRLVTIHQRTNGKLEERPNPEVARTTPIRGDGGLFSTAQDYGKFLRLFLNGGRVGATRQLSEASIREMTRNHIGRLVVPEQPAANPTRTRPFPLGAGRDTWGLGFQLAAPPLIPDGRGTGSYSWAGINNTHFWVDPTRQIGVVVLMQVLPFYDDACIKLLTDLEHLVNRSLE